MREAVTDVNLYINFVLHAIFGRLSEADMIMRMVGPQLHSVADYLTKKHPIDPKPLYRGLLLDPAQPFKADPKLTFLSWSEDRDVAEWFACPRSVISEPAMHHNPKLRGHIIELSTAPRVLFHHSWTPMFGGLAPFARQHPFMGDEGVRQIEWSLRTQREVITEPVEELQPKRTRDLDATTLGILERRLSPPWIVAEEGIRS